MPEVAGGIVVVPITSVAYMFMPTTPSVDQDCYAVNTLWLTRARGICPALPCPSAAWLATLVVVWEKFLMPIFGFYNCSPLAGLMPYCSLGRPLSGGLPQQ